MWQSAEMNLHGQHYILSIGKCKDRGGLQLLTVVETVILNIEKEKY